MISVLVTGKDSQLALCIRDLQQNYPEMSFDFKNSKELDITSEESIAKTFEANTYDYCVNCAAYTAVDKAETEPEKAKFVNTIGVKNLALACKKHNVVLIHISTDFVFDGKKKTPYTEGDQTNPINVYGKTKRDGEMEIQKGLDKYFIIRTSWLYSQYGSNFVKTILRLSKEKDEINVVNDQIGSPTNANDLASAIGLIIKNQLKGFGIYHYCNSGKTSWFSFAKQILENYNFDFIVKPIKSKNYKTTANRPSNSQLSSVKFKKATKTEIINWKMSLKNFLTTKYG